MPFEAYSAYFRPEELGILAAAYDAAWQDLWTERLTLGAEQTSVLKKNLAQIILASACNGKGTRTIERGCAKGSIKAGPSFSISETIAGHALPGFIYLVGLYCLVSVTLNGFDVQVPESA
jgi:hypothetical protein